MYLCDEICLRLFLLGSNAASRRRILLLGEVLCGWGGKERRKDWLDWLSKMGAEVSGEAGGGGTSLKGPGLEFLRIQPPQPAPAVCLREGQRLPPILRPPLMERHHTEDPSRQHGSARAGELPLPWPAASSVSSFLTPHMIEEASLAGIWRVEFQACWAPGVLLITQGQVSEALP